MRKPRKIDREFSAPIIKPSSVRGFTLNELLVVVGIIAFLIALLIPATRSARPAARRSQCANNLKQIALALHNYEQAHKALPPAYTVDAEGRPLHSWRTLILPYMEQEPLYRTIDLSKPWDDPANAKALETVVPVYRCPEAEAHRLAPLLHPQEMRAILVRRDNLLRYIDQLIEEHGEDAVLALP